jgi:hypothetical protein
MAENGFKLIDAEMHVMEPTDLWQRYIDPEFRARAPRRLDERRWDIRTLVEGEVMAQIPGGDWPALTDAEENALAERYAEEIARNFDPETQVRAMDKEGLDLAILFPTSAAMTGRPSALLPSAISPPPAIVACCSCLRRAVARSSSPRHTRLISGWATGRPEQSSTNASPDCPIWIAEITSQISLRLTTAMVMPLTSRARRRRSSYAARSPRRALWGHTKCDPTGRRLPQGRPLRSVPLFTTSGSNRERYSRSTPLPSTKVTSRTAGTWRISRSTSNRCRSSMPSRHGNCTVHCNRSVMSSKSPWILPAD